MKQDRRFQESIDDYRYHQQITRPPLSWYIGRWTTRGIIKLVRTAWAIRITLLWAITLILCMNGGNLYLALWIMALASVIALYVWKRYTRAYRSLPIVGDIARIRYIRTQQARIIAGNALLAHAGLMADDDPIIGTVWLDSTDMADKLTIAAPLPRISTEKTMKTLESFKDVLGAVRMTATQDGDGYIYTFWKQDPLDNPVEITEPGDLDPEKMAVPCAVNTSGDVVPVVFKNNAGLIVGGVPGSGKTAGMTSFLLPMALSETVDLHIIDGKGGHDWDAYGPIASTFLKVSRDIESVRDFIVQAQADMEDRIATQKDALGHSNFWSVPSATRMTAGEKLQLIIIDECQVILRKKTDKDQQKTTVEIVDAIEDIVRRGRSAGYVVILATQKPTADSIPTSIRDNAGLSICFRVKTDQAEEAVMGDILTTPDTPRATEIPAGRLGGAVMMSESGYPEALRFFFMDEPRQAALIAASEKAQLMSVSTPVDDNEQDGGFSIDPVEDEE